MGRLSLGISNRSDTDGLSSGVSVDRRKMSQTVKRIDAWKMAIAAVLLALAMSAAPGVALAAEGDQAPQGDQPAAVPTESESTSEEPEQATEPEGIQTNQGQVDAEGSDSGELESPGAESSGGQDEAVTEAAAPEAKPATETPETFTIAFNTNGGSWAAAELSGKGTKGTEIVLPTAGDVSKGGYTLVGWATSPDASPDAVMAPGSTYTVNGDETLYAVWVKHATVMYAASNAANANANAAATANTPATFNMLAASGGTSMSAMASYVRQPFSKTNSAVYWSFSDSTKTLTISYSAVGPYDSVAGHNVQDIDVTAAELPWKNLVSKERIFHVEIIHDGTNNDTFIRPRDLSNWFQDHMNLQSFNGEALDTSLVTDFSNMFSGCTDLSSVTGTGHWITSNSSSFNNMFANDGKIEELDLKNWDTRSGTNQNMLQGVRKLTKLTSTW